MVYHMVYHGNGKHFSKFYHRFFGNFNEIYHRQNFDFSRSQKNNFQKIWKIENAKIDLLLPHFGQPGWGLNFLKKQIILAKIIDKINQSFVNF